MSQKLVVHTANDQLLEITVFQVQHSAKTCQSSRTHTCFQPTHNHAKANTFQIVYNRDTIFRRKLPVAQNSVHIGSYDMAAYTPGKTFTVCKKCIDNHYFIC